MRFSTKSSLALLALYLVVLATVALFMERRLQSVSETALNETAQLIGREVAATLTGPTLQQLLNSDPVVNQKLIEVVNAVTEHSQVVTSILVVDGNGTVIAGDRDQMGRQVSLPQLVFGEERRPRFVASDTLLGHGASYLFVPVMGEDQPLGYLRLSLRNERIGRLYQDARRQLLVFGLIGLLLVLSAGFILHLQLARVGFRLNDTLERAMHGQPGQARRGRDEFARAFATAQRVGQELQTAREQISQAQRRFRSLMKVMDVGVLLLKVNKELDFANDPARELLGCADTAALERRWVELAPMLDERLSSCGQQRSAGSALDIEVPCDGFSNLLRLELYQLNEEECQGYLILVKSRETIEALENELRLAIQMRGFAGFYMAFAHDLKAPLNAMVMNLELLRETLRNGQGATTDVRGRQQRYLEILKEEISRLDRYLQTLLSQAALPSNKMQEFDLREIFVDLATLLGPQAKQQRVALDTHLPAEAIPFSGHRDRLKQAMLNIAINALEAMPTGGQMSFSLAAAADAAQLWIKDSGPGIPPEILEDIYQMHFTTKDGGTGIGLYVARSVVEAHGGEIRVDTEPGRGTRFEVVLPLRGTEDAPAV